MFSRFSLIRRSLTGTVLGLSALLLLSAASPAGDEPAGRDIFDHAAHKAAKSVTRIALIADTDPHGPRGNHEFVAAAVYLARTINAEYPKAYAAVFTKQ